MSSRKKKPNWTSVIKDYSTQYDTKERRSVLRDKVRQHGASTLLSSMDSMHAAHRKRHPRASSVIDTNREWLEEKYKSSSRSRTPTTRSRSRSQSPTRSISSSSSSSPIRRYYHYYGYRYPYPYYKYAKYLTYPWCYYNDCSSPVVIHKQAPSVPVNYVLNAVMKIHNDHGPDVASAMQRAAQYVRTLSIPTTIPENVINRLMQLHQGVLSHTRAQIMILTHLLQAKERYTGELGTEDILLLTALSGTWELWGDDVLRSLPWP
jgi:hypothetical protein